MNTLKLILEQFSIRKDLNSDAEAIVIKIYQYFAIYTGRDLQNLVT